MNLFKNKLPQRYHQIYLAAATLEYTAFFVNCAPNQLHKCLRTFSWLHPTVICQQAVGKFYPIEYLLPLLQTRASLLRTTAMFNTISYN